MWCGCCRLWLVADCATATVTGVGMVGGKGVAIIVEGAATLAVAGAAAVVTTIMGLIGICTWWCCSCCCCCGCGCKWAWGVVGWFAIICGLLLGVVFGGGGCAGRGVFWVGCIGICGVCCCFCSCGVIGVAGDGTLWICLVGVLIVSQLIMLLPVLRMLAAAFPLTLSLPLVQLLLLLLLLPFCSPIGTTTLAALLLLLILELLAFTALVLGMEFEFVEFVLLELSLVVVVEVEDEFVALLLLLPKHNLCQLYNMTIKEKVQNNKEKNKTNHK